MQTKVHADYLAWGWDVLLRLKLHESEMVHQEEDGDACDELMSQLNKGMSFF